MTAVLRIASLLLAAAGGLTAAPTRAGDATLGREAGKVELAASEAWALRPTRVTPAAAMTQRPGRTVPLSDLPGERRTVRVVYEGYREAGPLKTAR